MAALTSQQFIGIATDGEAAVCMFAAVRNVSSGDTLDVGPTGLGYQQNVHKAVCLFPDVSVTGDMAVAGTVITMPDGLAGSDGYVMIWGSAGI